MCIISNQEKRIQDPSVDELSIPLPPTAPITFPELATAASHTAMSDLENFDNQVELSLSPEGLPKETDLTAQISRLQYLLSCQSSCASSSNSKLKPSSPSSVHLPLPTFESPCTNIHYTELPKENFDSANNQHFLLPKSADWQPLAEHHLERLDIESRDHPSDSQLPSSKGGCQETVWKGAEISQQCQDDAKLASTGSAALEPKLDKKRCMKTAEDSPVSFHSTAGPPSKRSCVHQSLPATSSLLSPPLHSALNPSGRQHSFILRIRVWLELMLFIDSTADKKPTQESTPVSDEEQQARSKSEVTGAPQKVLAQSTGQELKNVNRLRRELMLKMFELDVMQQEVCFSVSS